MAQPSPRRVACGIALAAALVGRAGVAPAQDLFVVSRANGKVLRYAGGDGSFVRAVVETIDTGFRNPGGMALRPAAGELWVSSTATGELWRYDVASGAPGVPPAAMVWPL